MSNPKLSTSIKISLFGLIKLFISTRKVVINNISLPINGESMEPTLSHGDMVLYNCNDDLCRGDIINFAVIKDYNRIEFFIKRVIGLPGDTLTIRDSDGIILNNNNIFVPESYTLRPNLKLINDKNDNKAHKITIPKGHVYVLGDNRFNSRDSREFGAISTKLILGKVVSVNSVNDNYNIKNLVVPKYENLPDTKVKFKFSFLFMLKLVLFSILNKHKCKD